MSEQPSPKRRVRSYRDLTAWQEAATLARESMRVADQMPPGYAFLADQLRRAATSIPLNIAEGNGKRSRRDYLRSLRMARGSQNEVEAIIELLRDSPLATPEDASTLSRHAAHSGRLLSALIRSLEREQPQSRPSCDRQ